MLGWVNRTGTRPGQVYVFLRIRKRMVSLATRKTFEMVLVVSSDGFRFRSSVMSKHTLVLSFTICNSVLERIKPLDEIIEVRIRYVKSRALSR